MQIIISDNLRLANKTHVKKGLSRASKQIKVYVFVPKDCTYDYDSPLLAVRWLIILPL